MANNIIEFRLSPGQLNDFEANVREQGWEFVGMPTWKDTLLGGLGEPGDILWEVEVKPQ